MTERERYRWYAHEGEFEPGAEWEIKMKRRETRVCVRELLMACVRERDDLGLKFSLLSVCVCCVVSCHVGQCCGRINSCVGRANHRSFLMTLLLFLLTSLYGISLVLRNVCPRQNVLIALLYCPGVYSQYRFVFTTDAHTQLFLLPGWFDVLNAHGVVKCSYQQTHTLVLQKSTLCVISSLNKQLSQ